jgi:sialic acid synthase SpsE
VVGPAPYCDVIAEIGINHNGSLEIAKKLIDVANGCGCDAVKFQKRTVDIVYSPATLEQPRESPWGTTQRDQKEGLEFARTSTTRSIVTVAAEGSTGSYPRGTWKAWSSSRRTSPPTTRSPQR